MASSTKNFQEIMDQWDVFYKQTFPLIREYCIKNAMKPGASMHHLEKAFLKLSFEYPNLMEEEYAYIVDRLFDIIIELQDSMTEEENLHNNALILLSQYYTAN